MRSKFLLLGLLPIMAIAADTPPGPAPGAGPAPGGPGPNFLATATPAGTQAPDGIGATVAPSPVGAGQMANGHWEPESLMTPLKAGASMPRGNIAQTADGERFDVDAAVAAKPTVLIFYRGGWCPYCNAHLRDLQGSEPALHAMGYQILAVSAEPPAALRQTLTDAKLSYTLLSDASLEIATRFGLRYKLKEDYASRIRARGALAADNPGYLLTPGAFVLDRKGHVHFAYVNTNYAVRVRQDALLEAARQALRASP